MNRTENSQNDPDNETLEILNNSMGIILNPYSHRIISICSRQDKWN